MDTENEALLQELLRDTQKAPEPGTLPAGTVVSRGDDDGFPAPMVASKLLSAGYCYIYDTVTGDRSTTNMNMLPMQLRKKRPNGTPVFTTIRPKVAPKALGTLKCMLHADNPNREHYDELGLAVCRKANLTSPYQVKRHMQKRHKDEWATIEDERKANEATRQSTINEAMMTKLTEVLAPPAPPKPVTCDVCGEGFQTEFALSGHRRSHK